MSGDSLVVADYVVFALMLVVSAGIGVYFAWASKGKGTTRGFLTGNRKLTALPVALSLNASYMSSVTLLSNPAEVYRFGAIFGLFSIAYVTGAVITSEIFLPVFYRLGIASTYEYLELRFNRATRLVGTGTFIVQAVLFCGVIIYAPGLALAQVMNVDLWSGIISTGAVCILYSTLGGLKAVVWTDVFQTGVMFAGFLSVIIKSVLLRGGAATILSDAQQGGRLNFWDFDINPLRRHTVWTLVIGGTFIFSTAFGITPPQVQRYVSCKSLTHARAALYISVITFCLSMLAAVSSGLCIYSIYKDCDPWKAGLVSAPDQLMPYLMMDILTDYPGLRGLFLAAVYSGSLSTVSSVTNSLAGVTVADVLKPYTNMSEKHLYIASKALTFFYGVVCISMAGLASRMGGMMQASAVIGSSTGGPLLGLFSLGFLCRFANSKGALSGFLSGLVVSLIVTLGGLIVPPPPEMTRPLPLTTDGCNFTMTDGFNWTSTVLPTPISSSTTAPVHGDSEHWLTDRWHSPSYLYICLIGSLTALTVGVIISLLTGGLREKVDPELLLKKEDLLLYQLLGFFKGSVTKGTRKANVTDGERKNYKTPASEECELNPTESSNLT